MNFKRFDSSEGNVWKYVFEFEDAIAEAVLYRYKSFEKRTVICCSVQSGCPVGCVFCGTGKQFIRNLTFKEILAQISTILSDMGIEDINSRSERFQIMFMSMGEPFLNYENVSDAIRHLNYKYRNAELLVSTIGINSLVLWHRFIELSTHISKIGLQFSLHNCFEKKRNEIIPYKNKFSILDLRQMGVNWWKATGRPVFLNYCLTEDNMDSGEFNNIIKIFPQNVFNLTFSVICSPEENMKNIGYRDLARLKYISEKFMSKGYNTRVFDPAGQDDIGGGCGQLWYTQGWIKNYFK